MIISAWKFEWWSWKRIESQAFIVELILLSCMTAIRVQTTFFGTENVWADRSRNHISVMIAGRPRSLQRPILCISVCGRLAGWRLTNDNVACWRILANNSEINCLVKRFCTRHPTRFGPYLRWSLEISSFGKVELFWCLFCSCFISRLVEFYFCPLKYSLI